MTPLRALLPFVAVLALAAQKEAPPWEKPPTEAGRILFLENCTICHEANKPETKKMGGSLYRFFQKEDSPLPPAQREPYFRIKVMLGSSKMPSFRTRLTPHQIDLLIQFIRSKDGGKKP